MNKFYANGTPVLNSLAVQTDKPLDAREVVLDLAERDELVSKHLAYDKMRVHVKSNDTIYIYDKDNNKWIEDNYFSEDDKNKLDNIDEYLVNTTILYNLDKTLMIRKHSYNPSTDVTRLFDEKIQEAKVTEDGDLYNGLISKFYINRLNNITNYLIDREFTIKEGDTGLYSTVSRFNTDTKEITKEDLKIPVATDENDGLLSNIQNIKLNRIEKYVDNIDTKHTNVSDIGLQYSYNVYNPNTNENTTYTITIPLSTDSENGLMSNIEHTKLGRIIDYMTEIGTYNQDESGLKYVYKTFNPNTNTESEHDLIIPLSTHDLNGLLSNIDKIKLDDIESFLTNIELVESTDSEDLKLRLHITNPNTQQDTTSEFILPLVTDTHNGLVSPDIKHWIDQAKGLSNTGTTSDTWQLSKKDIDTKLDPNGGAILKSKDGVFEARNATDTDYTGLTVKDLIIKGNVTQEGDTFITEAETVEISDNTLVINKGETGAGVTKGIAGLIIDRGTSPDYQIIFDEKDDRFKAGEEGDLWCLALRDNDADLVDGYFTTWDATTKRLKTTNIIPNTKALYIGTNDYSLSSISNGVKFKITDSNYLDITTDTNARLNLDTYNQFVFKKPINIEYHNSFVSLSSLLSLYNNDDIFIEVRDTDTTGRVYKYIGYSDKDNRRKGTFIFDTNNNEGFEIISPRSSQGGGNTNHIATEEWVARQKLPVPNSLTWQDSSNVKQSFDGSEEKNLTLWRATHVGDKNYEGYVVAWNNTDITRPDDPTINAKWIKIKFPYKYSNNVPFQFTLDGFVNYYYFKIFCSGYLYYKEQNILTPNLNLLSLNSSYIEITKLETKLGVDSVGYGILLIKNLAINNNAWGLTIHDFNSSWNRVDWTTGWEISYSPDPDDTYKWALEKTLYDTVKEDELQTALSKYLPLAGGTMTGTIKFGNFQGIIQNNHNYTIIAQANDRNYFGNANEITVIRSSGDVDLLKGSNSYKLWDSDNLPERRTVKTSYPDKNLTNITSGNWYRICKVTSVYKSFLLSINHYTYNNYSPGSHLFSISLGSVSGSFPPIIKMLASNIRCFYNKLRIVQESTNYYIDVYASANITGNNVYASFIGDGVNDIEFILKLSPEPSADAKVYEFNISDIEVITNSQLIAKSGKYLPLAGGTLTGNLVFSGTSGIKYPNLTNKKLDDVSLLNTTITSSTTTSGAPTQYGIGLNIVGTDHTEKGYRGQLFIPYGSSEMYIRGFNSNNDAYTSWEKLARIKDTFSFTGTGNSPYLGANFTNSIYSKLAIEKYIEFWESSKEGYHSAGWFNFAIGNLIANKHISLINSSLLFKDGITETQTHSIGRYNGRLAVHGTSSSEAGDLNVGSLLVSNSWNDASKVPTNGIYSKGVVNSGDYFIANSIHDTTYGNIGYALLYGGKPSLGLGSKHSSGLLSLYRGISPNIGTEGYMWASDGTASTTGTALELGGNKLLYIEAVQAEHSYGDNVSVKEYNVWTEKNLLNPKFTYGFEYLGSPTSTKTIDVNTIFNTTKGGVVKSYNAPDNLLNKPKRMRYGSIYQLGDSSNTDYFRLQIAGDIVHAENNSKTGRLWYRMPGNGGLATAGWKRVLTAEDDLPNILTKEKADTYYYPINGKGTLSFNSVGEPIMANNRSYGFKDSNGDNVMAIWLSTANNLVIGRGSDSTGILNNIIIRGNLKNESNKNYLYDYYNTPKFSGDICIHANTTGGWAREINWKNNTNSKSRAGIGTYGSADSALRLNLGVITEEDNEVGWNLYNKKNTLEITSNNVLFGDKSLAVWGAESNALTKLLYNRMLTINGTGWSVVGTASGNMSTIYAPTTVGAAGQILQSNGSGAPVWADVTGLAIQNALQATDKKTYADTVASYVTSAINLQGIRIKLPFKDTSSKIVQFSIRFSGSHSFVDLVVFFYLYNSNGGYVYNPVVRMADGTTSVPVKIGSADDGTVYVWVGGLTQYYGVLVHDVTAAYASGDWSTGWKITTGDASVITDVRYDKTVDPPLTSVPIAKISDLHSTWDAYLKASIGERNIVFNGTTYPVLTDVSGATAVTFYAPATAGTSGQVLKSTGGVPSWGSLNIKNIEGGYAFAKYAPDNGVLIKTSIGNGVGMFYGRIYGNSYSSAGSFSVEFQGYKYNSPESIIQTSATLITGSADIIPYINMFVYQGYLHLWIPTFGSFPTYYIEIFNTNGVRIVTSVTDAAMPSSGVTLLTKVTPKLNTNSSVTIDKITDLDSTWDAILKASATSATFTPKAHNQASNTITAMTGYSKGSSTSAIAVSDSLNTAIGKLELRIDGKLTTTATSAGQATQVMVVTELPTSPQANTLYLIVE